MEKKVKLKQLHSQNCLKKAIKEKNKTNSKEKIENRQGMNNVLKNYDPRKWDSNCEGLVENV